MTESGPMGVLAGAGALGSTMLQLWRRAGWGRWTVIDPDHMRPHNVPRHWSRHVGWPKAEAVALSDLELWQDEEPGIAHVVDDAAALDSLRVLTPLRAATLIVDVTTTVEVPRRFAAQDDLGRVVSCFIGTPEGFKRGVEGLAPRIEDTNRRSAGQVTYLGEWHSHPVGASARPSADDIRQLLFLGALLQHDGLPALS